jgi:hypothetical protein
MNNPAISFGDAGSRSRTRVTFPSVNVVVTETTRFISGQRVALGPLQKTHCCSEKNLMEVFEVQK